MVTDDELVRRIAARDERAFALLWERHAGRARVSAARVCRDAADDAVQDAFFAVWRDAPRFATRGGGAAAWGHTIVRSLDVRRQQARRNAEPAAAGVLVDPQTPEDVALARDERARVRRAVDALPPAQRDVIVLAYGGELTQAEIASRLSLALGTVKGRTRLALRRLASELRG